MVEVVEGNANAEDDRAEVGGGGDFVEVVVAGKEFVLGVVQAREEGQGAGGKVRKVEKITKNG